MPSTLNGVGTHYYGQKNLVRRHGLCPHCKRPGQLASYDTRLWFVVVFIPIIPLGRKRIIDKCPSCSRHYAADAAKWETAKQLEVSGAEEKFRNATTPENAIEVHRQLVNFHQFDEAAAFRKRAGELLPESAMLQAYFGDALTYFGQLNEAVPFYARALALRPDLPQARIGMAEHHTRSGRLDEARPLLDFLEKPGASQLYSLSALETLALAYQKAGRHQEALDLFACLQTELPNISDIKAFRTMVQKSEKALGRRETLLKKKKFSWRAIFTRNIAPADSSASGKRILIIGGAVVAVILLCLAISNEYIRRHRTVYLINAHSQPATVSIDGTDIKKQFRYQDSMELPEGTYHAHISGPRAEEFDFEVRSTYFSRWSDDPAWLINVGGHAIVTSTAVTYQANPPPATNRIYFGKTFEQFNGITHPFTALPESMQLKSNESRTLVDLDTYKGDGENLFGYLLEKENANRALEFAETWLATHPDDESVLLAYSSVALQKHAVARADAYMQPYLAKRPTLIKWHRAYQEMHVSPNEHDALVANYDALLAASPTDSGLLYLRGRIDGRREITRDLFERSRQADPKNPFPLYGLAFDSMSAGDWVSAKNLITQAVTIRPDNEDYYTTLIQSRIALGDAAEVETDTRARLKRRPDSTLLHVRLIEALAAQNKPAEVLKVSENYHRISTSRGDSPDTALQLQRYALYANGDFVALEKASPRNGYHAAPISLAQSLIEQGKLADAIKVLPAYNPDDTNLLILALTLSVASREAGDSAQADQWLAKARESFAHGNEDYVQAGAWLGADQAPSLKQAQDLAMQPQIKAVLLLAVVAAHPESRAELTPLIKKLNVTHMFPFHFVRRAAP